MVEIFKIKAGMSLELMKCVFRFADVPFHLSNRSKYNRSIPCTKGPNYGEKFLQKQKIPNSLRNLKNELKVGVQKTIFTRYINCSLNM